LAEIGIGLIGVGLMFILLGVMLFLDSALIAMGNVRLQHLPAICSSVCEDKSQN
jgi:hypothetical protein